jgi:hypothetical protein
VDRPGHRHRTLTKLILDIDSSVSEPYGHQQGSAYNGYFECSCYHPLFFFSQFGNVERAMLRRGNHASAKYWRRVLLPLIERYCDRDIPKFFKETPRSPCRTCSRCWSGKGSGMPSD